MNKSYRNTLIAALFVGVSQSVWAEYSYLLNAQSLSVGEQLGEGLVVKESCVNPDDDEATCEKTKYVTALPGRTGRIEFPINVAGGFDASMNLDSNLSSGGGYLGETLVIYSPDGSSITLLLQGGNATKCRSSNSQDQGGGSAANLGTMGFVDGYASNDFRIGVENSIATCYCNSTAFFNWSTYTPPIPITLSNSRRTYNRLAVTGINDRDRLYEVKVRGLNPGGSTATCSIPATISSNLDVHISSATYQPEFGNPMSLWVDLQPVSSSDGSLMWKLSNYGLNQ